MTRAWALAELPPIKRKFHVLRHSRATELLRKRVFTKREMMKWFSWKTRKMIDIYSHITMEDVEESYLSAFYDKTQRRSQVSIKLCPRCGFSVNENFNFCPYCGQPLSTEASIELLKRGDEVKEAKALIDRLI